MTFHRDDGLPRTLDPTLPPPPSSDEEKNGGFFDFDGLPLPCVVLPPEVGCLRDCALHQIRSLTSALRDAGGGGGGDGDGDGDIADVVGGCSDDDYYSTTGGVLEDSLDDGFVLCDLNVVRRKLRAWRRMFPRVRPFYALKCNPDVMVAAVLGRAENQLCGFDCASPSEIRLALASVPTTKDAGGGGGGDPPRRCVYANPQRDRAALDAALARGVEALTYDGSEELGKVREAHDRRCRRWGEEEGGEVVAKSGGRRSGGGDDDARTPPSASPPPPPEMILRLLVPDATSSVPLGEKFGAPPGMIATLAEEAVSLGLPLVGVSFHCGSGCHDADAFGTAVRLAADALRVVNEVLDRHGRPRCSLLDIGGGYPGVDGVGGDLGRFCGGRSAFDDEEGVDAVDAEAEAEADRGGKGGTDEKKDEVGGGGGGITTAAIASVVTPLLDELFPPPSPIHVISEPGRYFVEGAFALCSRIYSTRAEVDSLGVETRRHYYIAQGVQGVFKDVLLCGESFVPTPLRLVDDDDDEGCRGGGGTAGKVKLSPTTHVGGELVAGGSGSPPQRLVPSTVHGPSGEDFDVVCPDCTLPRLERGDFLLFDRMGAYTLSIAARGGGPPVRYVVGGCGVGG